VPPRPSHARCATPSLRPCHGTILQRQYSETHALLRHVIASADTTLKAVVSAKGWTSETKQGLHDAMAVAQGASLAGRRLQSDLRHLMSKCRAGDTQAKLDFEAVGEAVRAAFAVVTADASREDARTCVRVSFRFPPPNVQVRGLACTCPLYITRYVAVPSRAHVPHAYPFPSPPPPPSPHRAPYPPSSVVLQRWLRVRRW
jgi:hypothetical protein